MIWLTDKIEVCDCPCHMEGRNITHMVSCCQFCYSTYLTPEGKLIPEKYEALERNGYINTIKKIVLEKSSETDETFLLANIEILKSVDMEELREVYTDFMAGYEEDLSNQ